MSDPLAPARGIIHGVIIGLALAAGSITLGALVFAACWQVIP